MSRVLVTGVLGFTGQYIVPRLSELGHEVHGLARAADRHEAMPGLSRLHIGELTDVSSLTKLLGDARPDWIVHLAGVSFVAHDDAAEIYSSNLLGTRNLLEATIRAGVVPSAILLASSANVYGNRREGVLDETVPPEPVSDYAVSKLAMEFMSRLYWDRIPIVIARPFNYTGVGQSLDFVIPKIVDHARRRTPTIELGNLDVERDFSDVRGVADAYIRLLQCPDAIGGIFNICSGRGYSLRQVIALVEQLSGHHFKVRVNPAFVRANEVRTLTGSNARAAELIGPLEMPPFAETLRWMLES